MATDYCKYHPIHTATWHCTTCYITLCDECVEPSVEPDSEPACFLCNQPVTSLHQVAPIVPFWLQYTQFMQLPLGLLGSFLLVLLFAAPIFMPQNLRLAIMFVAYTLASIYGWHLLQQAATGKLNNVRVDTLFKKTDKLTLQTGLFIGSVFVGLDVLVLKAPLLTHFLSLFLVCSLPAIFIAVILDKSIFAMFQLSNLKKIISELRFFYVPLVAASLLLLLISSSVVDLLADVLSSQIVQGLEQALYGYSLWVMMSIVGYVLFEFHQALDYEVLGKKNKKRSLFKHDTQQARLAVYVKEGAYEKAAALLKVLSEKQKNNPEIQQKYYQLLVFMQDVEQVPIQASYYIEALLAVGQVVQAIEVLIKVRRLVPDFMPPTPDARFNLAKACADNQQYKLSCDLLRHLHKEYPHYPELPEAYLFLSKVLHEKLKASSEALDTMDYLVSRFQKHPRYDVIDRVWRSLGGKPKQDFVL